MKFMIDALRHAVAAQAWYPALAFALTLPDTCRSVAGQAQTRQNYVDWCNMYLTPMYVSRRGKVFMTGDDCYSLRCSFLHSGEFEIYDKKGLAALQNFQFIVSDANIHCNMGDGVKLQLHVRNFCDDMCTAVEAWLVDIAADVNAQGRMTNLARIEFW